MRDKILTSQEVLAEWTKIETQQSHLMTCILQRVLDCNGVLRSLQSIYSYDYETFMHSLRVFYYATLIGNFVRLRRRNQLYLSTAALLHDVGKIKTPNYTILKEGKLSEQEYFVVKQHVLEGCLILQQNGVHKKVIGLVALHHERMDGTGYPFGLVKSEISAYGRYLAAADVYDAITAKRSYSDGMPQQDAVNFMMHTVGLDPMVTAMLYTSLDTR